MKKKPGVTGKVSKRRPKRPFTKVLESLRQVWQIDPVPDADAFWRMGAAESKALPAEGLRLAVWNLWKGSGDVRFEHDYRVVLFRSDLVLTQEALLSPRAFETFCEPGFAAVHAASYLRRDGLRDGVMTVCRAEPLGRSQRIVCKYPEPIFRTPKVALVEFFKIDGLTETLMVVNIHATLVRTLSGAVEEIRHVLSQLPTHEGPVLFGGDFNTFSPRYLSAISGELKSFGLQRVDLIDDPRPTTASLDQVFVRGLEVKRAFVDTMIRNSDHFPIFVDLAFENLEPKKKRAAAEKKR